MMHPKQMTGQELKERGIQQAVDHADRDNKDWSASIIQELRKWVSRQSQVFAIEDFRRHITVRHPDLLPPTPNAWGYLSRAALNLKIVRHIGYRKAKSPKTHGHRVMTFRRK